MLPRCGVCDRPSTLALCDACDEPMCAEHVTSRVVDGEREFLCTLCALQLSEEAAAPATSTSGAEDFAKAEAFMKLAPAGPLAKLWRAWRARHATDGQVTA